MSGQQHSKIAHPSSVVLLRTVSWSDLTVDLREIKVMIGPIRHGTIGWSDLSPDEQSIFIALLDKKWDWRTLAGLEKSTQLPRPMILEFLERHSGELEQMASAEHGTVYRLKSRWRSFTEWLLNQLERALDYLSLGMRSQNV